MTLYYDRIKVFIDDKETHSEVKSFKIEGMQLCAMCKEMYYNRDHNVNVCKECNILLNSIED